MVDDLDYRKYKRCSVHFVSFVIGSEELSGLGCTVYNVTMIMFSILDVIEIMPCVMFIMY